MLNQYSKTRQIEEISLEEIDFSSNITRFSFTAESQELLSSIKKSGLFNPVYLIGPDKARRFTPLCGHRRLDACRQLGWSKIPAIVLKEGPSAPMERLLFNVEENRTHRKFNGMEISNIVFKLKEFGMQEERIIGEVMHLLELEKSKKVYLGYLSLQSLNRDLQEYVVGANAPLKLSSRMASWKEEDQQSLASVIRVFHPGANKLKEMVEILEEIALRDGTTPKEILKEGELDAVCRSEELSPSDKARKLFSLLQEKRYPLLAGKRASMEQKMKNLGSLKGTALNYPKNWEEEELALSLRFSSAEELYTRLEAVKSGWEKEKIEGILKLLQE